jgi:glycosyltransferase involved in cell wall biosynthesis
MSVPSGLPVVSIVLPFKDAEAYLPGCLASISAQSLTDYELICVDDESRDRSAEILQASAAQDLRIKIISGSGGFVAALNRGLCEARAPLIARMDSDDIMMPDRLKLQSEYLSKHSEIDLVSCRVELFPEDAIRAGYREYIRWQNKCTTFEEIAANIYVESPFAHPSVMFRRDTVLRLGGYHDGEFPEDYDLWLRMHHAGCKMARLPEILLRWRERPNRLSRIDPRYSRSAFDNLRAAYLVHDDRIKNADSILIWGAGRRTRVRARRILNSEIDVRGWIDIDPRKIGKVLDDLPVYPFESLARLSHPFVLIYVTNHGAREKISSALKSVGYICGRSFLAVG